MLLLLDLQYHAELAQRGDRRLTAALEDARRQVEYHMTARISAVEDVQAFMLAQDAIPERAAFGRFATTVRSHQPSIDALSYVGPDLVIRYVHPLAGHAEAIGVDLSSRPTELGLREAVEKRELVVDSPHTIINGDTALLVRAPLYRGERFLGLVQGVFVMDDIAGRDLGRFRADFLIQLRDGSGRMIWGERDMPPRAQSVLARFGDNAWTVILAPRGPLAPASPLVLGTIWGGGLAMMVVLLYGAGRVWHHKQALDAAIAEQTAELRERYARLESEVARRTRTEAALRSSEARLKEAQGLARLGSWEWDTITGRLTWSDELYRIFGVEPGELEPTYEDYIRRVHPDDRPGVEARIAEALEQDMAIEHEYRVVWPDGSIHYIRGLRKVVSDDTGSPVRMLGTAQDVTDIREAENALRRSERKYRALLETASDGIALADLDGRFLDANRCLLESLGYTEEEFRGLKVTDIHPPGEAARLDEAFGAICQEGHSLVEHQVLRRDGSTYPAEVAGTLVDLDDQQVALGVFRDITERKRLETALRRYSDELAQEVARRTAELTSALQELESFSYSVSHDLRAPLRAVDGFGQALEEDYGDTLDADALGYVQRMRAAAERMAQLIDDLLALSRLGRRELERRHLDLSGLATEVVDELLLAEPGREVEVTIQPGLVVEADPTLMRALLTNLIGNALKFTRDADPARVELDAREDGGQTVYRVRDNGAGFDMAHSDQLFLPFHRLHHPDEFPGNGIGLATVKRIVGRHGGRIWAEAAPGQGAAFYFTLG